MASAQPVGGSAILLLENDSVEANAGVVSQLTRRTNVTASAFTRETRFTSAPDHNFSSRGARGMWTRSLTRSLGLRAGYSREELRQTTGGVDERFINEVLDLGVDFAKAFTMGRRTTLSFSTETSMLRENGGHRRFRLNGNVGLERRFLRTWVAQVNARRATEFLPGFRGPVFTERGRVSLAGYLASRLLFEMHGEGTRGELGVGDQNEFVSYTGDSRLTLAVTRHLGVFAQYLYTHYQMPPDPQALVTVPQLSRQGVSVGVRTWVSLIDKKKVPRDPR
jgi:hypothetical protein